jgi:hypothetical protein
LDEPGGGWPPRPVFERDSSPTRLTTKVGLITGTSAATTPAGNSPGAGRNGSPSMCGSRSTAARAGSAPTAGQETDCASEGGLLRIPDLVYTADLQLR